MQTNFNILLLLHSNINCESAGLLSNLNCKNKGGTFLWMVIHNLFINRLTKTIFKGSRPGN